MLILRIIDFVLHILTTKCLRIRKKVDYVWMQRQKKPLGDTLSTFSQTEETVQPPGEKPSTVTSAIFAEEVRAIPSTSKQIYLEIPASSSGVSHPSYCKRILKTQQENYLFHPKHVAHKLCSERSLTRG
jgi:hypothetical protein